MIRAVLKILFVLFLIDMASAPSVSAASTSKSSMRLFSCSVSSEPASADSSVPAGAVPLGLAMADFTGDSHPDLATLELDRIDSSHAYYVIEIRLTEGGRQSLKLTSPARGLVITPMDVTGDGTLDLVVRSVGSKIPVAVFLNDGCGHFSANESGRFAAAIREIPGGPYFSASYLHFESAATRARYTADSYGQPRGFRHGDTSSYFFSYNGAPAQVLLPLRTDRAPPVAA